MSTSPRARARPSIDVASAGSTIAGNSVTMSIRISELQEPLARLDHDPPRRRHPARLAAITRRVPQHALAQGLEPLGPIGEGRDPHLAGEPVRPADLADRDEPALCHSFHRLASDGGGSITGSPRLSAAARTAAPRRPTARTSLHDLEGGALAPLGCVRVEARPQRPRPSSLL